MWVKLRIYTDNFVALWNGAIRYCGNVQCGDWTDKLRFNASAFFHATFFRTSVSVLMPGSQSGFHYTASVHRRYINALKPIGRTVRKYSAGWFKGPRYMPPDYCVNYGAKYLPHKSSLWCDIRTHSAIVSWYVCVCAYCILKILFVSSLCTSIAHCVSLFQTSPAQPWFAYEHVIFQATSSMSPWASLAASDSNQ